MRWQERAAARCLVYSNSGSASFTEQTRPHYKFQLAHRALASKTLSNRVMRVHRVKVYNLSWLFSSDTVHGAESFSDRKRSLAGRRQPIFRAQTTEIKFFLPSFTRQILFKTSPSSEKPSLGEPESSLIREMSSSFHLRAGRAFAFPSSFRNRASEKASGRTRKG